MFLHFQDWSEFLGHVNLPSEVKGDRVIKVYATDLNPQRILGRSALKVIEMDARPFPASDAHTYAGGRTWLGHELEEELVARGLQSRGQRTVRALSRFLKQYELDQPAMAVRSRSGTRWRFQHPFDIIHGIERDRILPVDERAIHIDLISKHSLGVLSGIVDYRDPTQVLSIDEGTVLRDRGG